MTQLPPHNKESEQAYLGALIGNKRLSDSTLLASDDFYFENHKIIFKAIRWLSLQKGGCDIVALTDYLENQKVLENIGGRTYLVSLFDTYCLNPLIQEQMILQKSRMRKIADLGQRLADSANSENEEDVLRIKAQIENAEGGEAISDDVELLAEIAKRQQPIFAERYKTGISMIDEASRGGLKNGDYIIVAGLPGHGKSALCQQICAQFSEQALPVIYFSYEILLPFLWDKFKAMGVSDECLLYAPLQNVTGRIDWVERKIKEAKQKHFIKLVVIDDMSYLTPKLTESNISRNFSAYVEQISKELKSLAVREEIIIITPSPLKKTDSPTINDIRDSSGPAHKADMVIAINRLPSEDESSGEYYSMISEMTILKQRETGYTGRGYFTMTSGKFKQDFSYRKQVKKRF